GLAPESRWRPRTAPRRGLRRRARHTRIGSRRVSGVSVRDGYPDRGDPPCPCGCVQTWDDKYHMWVCPHCDLKQTGPQQTVPQMLFENEDNADELLRVHE